MVSILTVYTLDVVFLPIDPNIINTLVLLYNTDYSLIGMLQIYNYNISIPLSCTAARHVVHVNS